jgi:hypothetical protein
MAKKTTASKTSSKGSSIPKLEVDSNSSLNVRKIENGYLVSESGTTGKGKNQQWYNKEYYSAKNPVTGKSSGVKFGSKK